MRSETRSLSPVYRRLRIHRDSPGHPYPAGHAVVDAGLLVDRDVTVRELGVKVPVVFGVPEPGTVTGVTSQVTLCPTGP